MPMRSIPASLIPRNVDRWISDTIDKPTKLVVNSSLLLSLTPDSIHLGYDTFPLAVKNRLVGAVVHPDYSVIPVVSTLGYLVKRVSNCHVARTDLEEQPDGEWKELTLPDRLWGVAPVDKLPPELASCDLATLLPYTLPVLFRECQRMVRRYQLCKSLQQLDVLDSDWASLLTKYTMLGATVPDSILTKRATAIAKARLTANI